MNAFERFFHGEHGASRAYLFAKGFLLLLALDTWMLMIGHAGRYGIASFNVAHFVWLDAVQPTPSAAMYVGVLVLTGLLALVIVLTGIRRAPLLLLFALYTLSWSMSMLDSYQHHYFVSLVLLCLAFFPEISASEIHPLPPALPESEKLQRRKHREFERHARSELYGWLYTGWVVAVSVTYAAVDVQENTWLAFFAFAGAIAFATWLYRPEPRAGGPLQVPGFGFSLLGASVMIVYTYTAIAKMDADWTAGHTLLRISAVERLFGDFAAYAERLGMARERFWSLLSTAVIPQELALGVCYLCAVVQDRSAQRWPRVVCMLGFALAIVLHIGAEAMGLEIGWFSYYMLLLAVCYLLPLPVVDRLVTVFTWPARFWQHQMRELTRQSPPFALQNAALALGSSLLLLLIGYQLDLPGAMAASGVAAAALLLVTLATQLSAQRPDPRPFSIAVTLAGALMWIAIAASPVRWDFYRFLGGDLSRRGELEAALDIYLRGERYAPPGQSRSDKIAELKATLGK